MSTVTYINDNQAIIDGEFRARALEACSAQDHEWQLARSIDEVRDQMLAEARWPSAGERMNVRHAALRALRDRRRRIEQERRGVIPDSFDLAAEPGLLGKIARWSLRYAIRPVPEFAQLSALAALAPVFARRYMSPTEAGLNLYLVGLAHTGAGKEALMGCAPAALRAADLGHLVGAGDFTSDSAFEVAIRARPNFIAPIDEVSEFIGAAQHKLAASHSRTIRKALLDIYSKSRPDAAWTGKQKADPEHDKAADPVWSPSLSLLGASTVTGFYSVLTEANLSDGFLNRLTVVEGGPAGDINLALGRSKVPDDIVSGLRSLCPAAPAGNLGGMIKGAKPKLVRVPWADDRAEQEWLHIYEWQVEAEVDGRGGTAGRAGEQSVKIATIRALARDGERAAVRVEDVRWAWEFVKRSIEAIERGARENMAGSEFETLVKAVERAVAKAGPEGIVRSVLLKSAGIPKYHPKLVDSAVDWLVQAEKAWKVIAAPRGGGRTSERIRLRRPDERERN